MNDTDRIQILENQLQALLEGPRPFSAPQLDPHTDLILKRNILKPVSGVVASTAAATAANYGCFFVADRTYEVISISEVHFVAGTNGGAVTISVEKCNSGVAPGSGVDLLASALSLKATINTPQFGSLTLTKSSLLLIKGDRLVLKDTGTLTDVADVAVTVLLRER